MASSTTTTLTLRVPNEDADALHQLAERLDIPTSTMGAALLTDSLASQEDGQTSIAAVNQAIELLERRSACSDHRERRHLLLEALARLRAAE